MAKKATAATAATAATDAMAIAAQIQNGGTALGIEPPAVALARKLAETVAGSETAIADATSQLRIAEGSQTENLVKLLAEADAKPITSASWDASYRNVFRESLKTRVAEGSVSVLTNRVQLACIAITNGILPERGEALRKFAERVKGTLKESGLYSPKNAGNAGARTAPSGEPVSEADAIEGSDPIESAALALARLAKLDLADAEMLRLIATDANARKAARAALAAL